MTNSEKKVWLERYRVIRLEVEHEMEEAEYFKEKAFSISAVQLRFDKVRNRSFTPQDYLAEYLTIIQECVERFNKANAEKDKIEAVIKQVEKQPEQEVLWRRYIDCESFKVIAKKMNYHVKSILRLHRKALNLIKI